jgi:hypothetical protein
MQCEYFILLNNTGIYFLEQGGGEILQGAKMKVTPPPLCLFYTCGS